MSSDARTLPLQDTPLDTLRAGSGRRLLGGRAGALAQTSTAQRIGALALIAIVACSFLVVVMAANRPSILSPTTHSDFFPHWMAGPLGGIWPGLTRSTTTLKYLFTAAIVAMYAGYLLALVYVPRLRARWVIAAILENPDEHAGQAYPLFGAVEMNHYQIADAISEALGRPVRYEPADIPTWIEGIKAQGFPEFLAQHLSNVAVDYQNGIFAGNNDLVERIGGKKPTTVQEFITDHLAAFTS